MRIVVPRETRAGERRVALTPEAVKKLGGIGHTVSVEAGAGEEAFYPDDAYRQVGVRVDEDLASLLASAQLVLGVNAPSHGASSDRAVVEWMQPGTIWIGSLMPLRSLDAVHALASRGITAYSTDAIPRTTRAQSMDTLSSMANIAGYKGAIIAAGELSRYFPMLMTAAGTVFPAKVLVVGAAVAGLQAIATARRLGAHVVATDVRPEVKEQIESLGAKYVGVTLKENASAGGGYARELSEEDKARQREFLAEQCAAADVVITTALIGGVFAPRLITAEMVRRMRPGAVIVDLGAEGGGNCELSQPGETIVENGVKIVAPVNLPSTMATHASLLFSRNVTAFIEAFTKDKAFHLDLSDDIQKASIITHAGEVLHAPTRQALQAAGAGRS